jgi:hypothetical protein
MDGRTYMRDERHSGPRRAVFPRITTALRVREHALDTALTAH